MQNFKFVQNRECEYFPCHKLEDDKAFNCLFCYCPLYALKDQCGGDFVYLKNGIKSCQGCIKPHDQDGYDHVSNKMQKVMELGKKDTDNK